MDDIQNSQRCFRYAALVVILLSIVSFAVNHYVYQFPGNNYFPTKAWIPGIYLICAWLGIGMTCDFDHYATRVLHNILLLYITLALIAILTNAAQFTPFPAIDQSLIDFESKVGINLADIMYWASQHPNFHYLLVKAYASIALQLSVLPFVLCFFSVSDKLREFYCLMLLTAIIGFVFYYFFPTTAPASNISSPLFSRSQLDTGLKFQQIHHYIPPATIDGGMIAMPSFHVIWAWLCLYLARTWKPLLIVFLPLNTLLLLSCVLLGWHYPSDLAGSLFVILLAHWIHHFMKLSLEPRPDRSTGWLSGQNG